MVLSSCGALENILPADPSDSPSTDPQYNNQGTHIWGGDWICDENGLAYMYLTSTDSYEIAIGTCKDTDIVIPSTYNGKSVTHIASGGFQGREYLKSVSIPDSITNVGEDAFADSINLQYNEYNNACYLGNSENPYLILVKPKDTSIVSCVVSNTAKVICCHAFCDCKNLEEITFEDNSKLLTVGDASFINCCSLRSIAIPNSVTWIGKSALEGCSNLIEISIPFIGCEKKPSPTYQFGWCFGHIFGETLDISRDGIYSISKKAPASLKSVIITGETSIGYGAFSGYDKLNNIVFTENSQAESIGQYAFSGCSSLTSVTLPKGVTSIDYHAFSGCTDLTSITFQGTQTQWNAISKGENWNYNTGFYTITCTDGTISK